MKKIDTDTLLEKQSRLEQLKYDFDMEFRSYLNFVEDNIAPEKLQIAELTIKESAEIVKELSQNDKTFPSGLTTIPNDIDSETNLEYIISLFDKVDSDIYDAISDNMINIYIIFPENIRKKFSKGSFKPAYKDGYELFLEEINDYYIQIRLDETEYLPNERFELISYALDLFDVDFTNAVMEDDSFNKMTSVDYFKILDKDDSEIFVFHNLEFNSIEDAIEKIESNIPEEAFELRSDLSTDQGICDKNENIFWGSDVIDHLPSSPTTGLSHKIIPEDNDKSKNILIER